MIMNMILVIVATIMCMSDVYSMEQGYLPTEKHITKRDYAEAQTTDRQKKHKNVKKNTNSLHYKVACDHADCDEVMYARKASSNSLKALEGLYGLFRVHNREDHDLAIEDNKKEYVYQSHWTVSEEQIKEKYAYMQCEGCSEIFCCLDSCNVDNKKENNLIMRFKTHLNTCKNKNTNQQEKLRNQSKGEAFKDIIPINNIKNEVPTFESTCSADNCDFSFDSIESEHVENIMKKHIRFAHGNIIEKPVITEARKKIAELVDKMCLVMCIEPRCNFIMNSEKNDTNNLRRLFYQHIKAEHFFVGLDGIDTYIRTRIVRKPYEQYEKDIKNIQSSALQCEKCRLAITKPSNVHKELFDKKHIFLHKKKNQLVGDDLAIIAAEVLGCQFE